LKKILVVFFFLCFNITSVYADSSEEIAYKYFSALLSEDYDLATELTSKTYITNSVNDIRSNLSKLDSSYKEIIAEYYGFVNSIHMMTINDIGFYKILMKKVMQSPLQDIRKHLDKISIICKNRLVTDSDSLSEVEIVVYNNGVKLEIPNSIYKLRLENGFWKIYQ
jgi:hypothetical protein